MGMISAKYILAFSLYFLLIISTGFARAADSVLVFQSQSQFMFDVVDGIRDEVEPMVQVKPAVLSDDSTPAHIDAAIDHVKPKLIVLLGNNVIRHYIEYQKSVDSSQHPPVVLAAALYVDQLVSQLDNATGIRYEIPVVTSAVNLRSLHSSPVKKIGVVHREWLSEFIAINAELCRAEGFELVSVKLPNNVRNVNKLLSRGLKKLSSDVDAFWVVNDNALLNGELISSVWIPKLEKFKKPVIVGVEALVETKIGIGSLSVSPDHYALGIQAGSKILDIRDQSWQIEDMGVEQPLSVTKVLNLVVSRDRKLKIDETKLGDIDRVIEE